LISDIFHITLTAFLIVATLALLPAAYSVASVILIVTSSLVMKTAHFLVVALMSIFEEICISVLEFICGICIVLMEIVSAVWRLITNPRRLATVVLAVVLAVVLLVVSPFALLLAVVSARDASYLSKASAATIGTFGVAAYCNALICYYALKNATEVNRAKFLATAFLWSFVLATAPLTAAGILVFGSTPFDRNDMTQLSLTLLSFVASGLGWHAIAFQRHRPSIQAFLEMIGTARIFRSKLAEDSEDCIKEIVPATD